MMKQTTILLLLFVLTLQVSAQSLDGCYRHQNDSISFIDDKATFSISGFGALTTTMVGEGTFEVIDDFLLIHTNEYSGEKTITHSFDGNVEDTVRLHITTIENYPVKGAMVDFLNAKNRLVTRAVSDDNGWVNLEKKPKQIKRIAKIKVSNLGYSNAVIDFNSSSDYQIKLAKNNVIENQTVAFEIEDMDVASVSIILIEENFNAGKDRMKSLQRLSKQTKKRNRLGKIFRKEYDGMFDGR